MAPTTPLVQPSDSAQLDLEIAEIRTQIRTLTQRRATLTSTLLSTTSSQSLLKRMNLTPKLSSPTSTSIESILQKDNPPLTSSALLQSKEHTNHSTECLYRMCSGATMFRVLDPDPNAVDEGKVYGVRIEVFSKDKFLPPYYLLLNRPFPNSPASLRLHRHTIPPNILNLQTLREKYLPAPTTTKSSLKKQARRQNLPRFVRELRRELVAFHLREASIESLRETLGLDNDTNTHGAGKGGVKDLKTADPGARTVRIEWSNGDIGNLKLGVNGSIESCVILNNNGNRERVVERQLMSSDGGGGGGSNGHISEPTERLLT